MTARALKEKVNTRMAKVVPPTTTGRSCAIDQVILNAIDLALTALGEFWSHCGRSQTLERVREGIPAM